MARERSVSDVCEVLALGWSFRGEFFLCISREICTVPSLYRPSTEGLIFCPSRSSIYTCAKGWRGRDTRVHAFVVARWMEGGGERVHARPNAWAFAAIHFTSYLFTSYIQFIIILTQCYLLREA